ncbi:hypothetical protein LOTGIDRAFT_159199 [Lottia gigantea]|uniref:Uncharacterized protein n=1 Tax=Lottia gigantea TaxID=225164 RepID=V4A3H6_LOTGI|nr:hypothetical protein LOTGIDRAFT_159199 [Lottia gigantea]ESO98393.1 hypothetical protein LOTGIDRAFT_159199 [Lottia gigantea]
MQTCYIQLQKTSQRDEKHQIFLHLSKLLTSSLELIRGRQSLHFTALSTINRIIDMCIVHRNYEYGSVTKSADFDTPADNKDIWPSTIKRKEQGVGKHEESGQSTLNRIASLHKRRTSVHDTHADKHNDEEEDGKHCPLHQNRTPLEIMMSMDPSCLMSVLHNNITMHKRIIGTRQKCTPSVRWRHCTHHCLQILSARIVTVMCHGSIVQNKIVSGGHVRTLVEALDPNHDPHLLCLLLQALACIALNPAFHQCLHDADIADMLMQLLLPSDEWYYTNHSTKYAKFVKYHAARILVYMGLLHKLGGRVDLFDRKPFQELNTTGTTNLLQVHSPEDSFIELMAMGHIIIWSPNHTLHAASLEGLIAEIIQEAIEEEKENQNPIIHLSGSVPSLYAASETDYGPRLRTRIISPMASSTDSFDKLNAFQNATVREYIFTALPIVAHPIIVLRLIAHKLFGNMIRRKTMYSDAKLKPPKVERLDACPPRRDTISECSGDPLSKRRKADLQVVISNPIDHSAPHMTKSTSVQERELHNKVNNTNKNGTTKYALRAIGESLVTPLDLNIHQSQNSEPLIDPSDSIDPKASSSKKLFRWPSKRRLSKPSIVHQQSVHRDSIVSIDDEFVSKEPESLGQDVDIVAFQRELINLPTFVMETPPVDISPVFSRSSSVPDNLACRTGRTDTVTINGSFSQIAISGMDLESNLDQSKNAIVTPPQSLDHLVTGSLVTITTTDCDNNINNIPMDSLDDSDSLVDNVPTNIVVHFEAPSSPQPSTGSQSSQHVVFEYPPNSVCMSIPNSSSCSHLLPNSDSLTLSSPVQSQPQSSFPSQLSPTAVSHCSSISSQCTAKSSSPLNSPFEIPYTHRGILKVMETWISVCRVDLDGNNVIAMETRDFLKKLSILGHDYKLWCQKTGALLHLEDLNTGDSHDKEIDGADNINGQYSKGHGHIKHRWINSFREIKSLWFTFVYGVPKDIE